MLWCYFSRCIIRRLNLKVHFCLFSAAATFIYFFIYATVDLHLQYIFFVFYAPEFSSPLIISLYT